MKRVVLYYPFHFISSNIICIYESNSSAILSLSICAIVSGTHPIIPKGNVATGTPSGANNILRQANKTTD